MSSNLAISLSCHPWEMLSCTLYITKSGNSMQFRHSPACRNSTAFWGIPVWGFPYFPNPTGWAYCYGPERLYRSLSSGSSMIQQIHGQHNLPCISLPLVHKIYKKVCTLILRLVPLPCQYYDVKKALLCLRLIGKLSKLLISILFFVRVFSNFFTIGIFGG